MDQVWKSCTFDSRGCILKAIWNAHVLNCLSVWRISIGQNSFGCCQWAVTCSFVFIVHTATAGDVQYVEQLSFLLLFSSIWICALLLLFCCLGGYSSSCGSSGYGFQSPTMGSGTSSHETGTAGGGGFWSGAATGGILGYLLGSSSSRQRYHQPYFDPAHNWGSSGFGSSSNWGSSGWGSSRGSSGSGSSSSGTRTASGS